VIAPAAVDDEVTHGNALAIQFLQHRQALSQILFALLLAPVLPVAPAGDGFAGYPGAGQAGRPAGENINALGKRLASNDDELLHRQFLPRPHLPAKQIAPRR
jgi:hypothetical protein